MFPGVRKTLCAGHCSCGPSLTPPSMPGCVCRHEEFGSSQRAPKRSKSCPSSSTVVPATSHGPLPTNLQAKGPKPQGLGLEEERSQAGMPAATVGVLALPDTVSTLLWLRRTSMAPLFSSSLLFLTTRGPSRNLKGQGVSLLPSCNCPRSAPLKQWR